MHVYGTPNARRDNLVLVCHALTGTSEIAAWWPALLAPGALFDTREWCVIGVPCHPELVEGRSPSVTLSDPSVTLSSPSVTLSLSKGMSDIVRAQREMLTQHGFDRFRVVIGGSLGGMQALQWALDAPERVDHAIVVGAHDHQSAMGIAFNAVQREAIALNSARGLGLARKIAMLTYKSEELLNVRHGRRPDRNDPSRFDIEGYLDLQAQRFIDRFDAATYVACTHLMDSFDVRHRAGESTPELTFVGISSDWLYRPQDIRAAAERFNARYLEIESDHGHDAFLAEPKKLDVTLSLSKGRHK